MPLLVSNRHNPRRYIYMCRFWPDAVCRVLVGRFHDLTPEHGPLTVRDNANRSTWSPDPHSVLIARDSQDSTEFPDNTAVQ